MAQASLENTGNHVNYTAVSKIAAPVNQAAPAPVPMSYPPSQGMMPQYYAGPMNAINLHNFYQAVPNVGLDSTGKYMEQRLCTLCGQALLTSPPDVRVLPCGHVLHGPCAYMHLVERGQNNCVVGFRTF
jgi:hypothetical protein